MSNSHITWRPYLRRMASAMLSARVLVLRIGSWAAGLILGVLLVLHAIRALQLFPSAHAVVDDRPLIAVDHAIHLYHGYLGAKFLREHGSTWGYDPYFMAGYPKTPVYDSSSGPAELVQWLAGGYSPRAYKLLVLSIAFFAPVAVILAAAVSMTPRKPTGTTTDGTPLAQHASGDILSPLLGALFVLWYWWMGFADVLLRTGLVAFLWASGLGVLFLALLLRHGERAGWPTGVAIALVGALAWQAHATFAVQVVVPMSVWYAIQARRHGWRWHAGLWVAAGVSLGATSFWWWPLIRFLPLKTGSDMFMIATDGWHFLSYYLRVAEARLPLLILLLGMAGLAAWLRERRFERAAVVGSHLAVLSLLSFWGSLWTPTRHLEPLRFEVPLTLAWCLPAGRGGAALLRALVAGMVGLGWAGKGSGLWARCRSHGPAAVAAGLYLALLWFVTMPLLAQVTRRQATTRRPLTVGLKPEMEALVDWLRTHTDTSARLLFEDQLRLWELQDSETLHWTPLLPLLTGRQFVGGLYHMAFIPHQDAAFGDWKLSGRHIREWSSRDLAAFCERYNIGWVVTWSRASPRKESGAALSTEVFASLPGCRQVATLPRHSSRPDENRYTIFELDRPHSYFARGRGRVVQVDYNRIELADIEPQDGQIEVRFHWQAEFVADPPVPLEPAAVPGDRIGFVRVRSDRPMARLVIRNGYRGRP